MSLAVHPLPIYFGLWSLASGLVAYWALKRRAYAGQSFLIFLLFEGTGKFVLEFLRFERLPTVQSACLSLAALAGTVLVVGKVARWR